MLDRPAAEMSPPREDTGTGDAAGGWPGWQGGQQGGLTSLPMPPYGDKHIPLQGAVGLALGRCSCKPITCTRLWSSPSTPPPTPASTLLPSPRVHPALQSPVVSWGTSPCTRLCRGTKWVHPCPHLGQGDTSPWRAMGSSLHPFWGLAGGREGRGCGGQPPAGSWLEWPCEEGHLDNACKSAPRLESSKVLSYYLSGGSILVSSGPALASRQLQGWAPCSALLCRDVPPPGRAAQGKPRQLPLGNTFLQTPDAGACPLGAGWLNSFLPPTSSPCFHHLCTFPPAPLGAFWHPSAPSDHVLALYLLPRS